MSSTRSVKSPGVWGADASTSIPASPLAGVSYRNTGITSGQTRGGWPFDTLVDSAKFNELLYRYTSLLDVIDRQGVLGWSDQVDYAVPALAWGSDGALYRCLLASGPSTTARDPVSAPAGYWEVLATAGASASKTGNGWLKLPAGMLLQWGTTGAIPNGFNAATSFPIAFPTACLVVLGVYTNATATGSATGGNPANVFLSTSPQAQFFVYNGGGAPSQYSWIALGH